MRYDSQTISSLFKCVQSTGFSIFTKLHNITLPNFRIFSSPQKETSYLLAVPLQCRRGGSTHPAPSGVTVLAVGSPLGGQAQDGEWGGSGILARHLLHLLPVALVSVLQICISSLDLFLQSLECSTERPQIQSVPK